MRPLRILLSLVMVSMSAAAFAEASGAPAAPAPSPAKQSFEQLKSLAGSWEGRITTNPPAPEVEGKIAQVTLRVTSMGNALMHEMRTDGRPDDPITMLYMDGDNLLLTHYCDAGNRPRMQAKPTTDTKAVEFEFLDVAGSTKYGHMHHAVFTPVDANHHTEDWTFMVGDKPVQAHIDLVRKSS
jgi:hypothetical protein